MLDSKIQWIIGRHVATNHMYDTYLPYEFHLRMVVKTYEQFKYLLPTEPYWIDPWPKPWDDNTVYWDTIIERSCWGHDLIEDTRTSYNDVKDHLGVHAADVIYVLTNEKGRNRAERGNDNYYLGIRTTPGAVFVKLCDRIANAQYSKMSGSRMFEMYKKENDSFLEKMGYGGGSFTYHEMFTYLIDLFKV